MLPHVGPNVLQRQRFIAVWSFTDNEPRFLFSLSPRFPLGPYFANPQMHEKHNPAAHVAKWQTPMLVIHGEKDYRVPPEQGIATFTALQRRGIDSQLLIFPDENHWVLKPQNSVQWHDTVRAWLQRWVGG